MSEQPYFPNQPAESLGLEHRFRAEIAKLQQESRLALYEIFSQCQATFTPTKFSVVGEQVVASQNDREIAFPNPIPMVKLSHVVFGYEQWLRRKYCIPGFVEVEHGDVVIDCGAYVGGFSFGAAKVAAHVHAFEPESRNFACLVRNFDGVGNVTLNRMGLYSETRLINLNISASSVEHSLLEPDDGAAVDLVEVSVVKLKDYVESRHISALDFVKIEAEGVELEVFEGLEDLKPRKFAIDVSPERNGESPAGEFLEQLRPLGYDVVQRGHVMFAKLLD